MTRRSKKDNYWGALILDWFHYLQDEDFRSSDYKILFHLCSKMKHDDNTAYLKQKEIAEHLNMNKGNVSKSIKRLTENQFIIKRDNGFMINPHLFYVGRFSDSLREDFDDLLLEKNEEPRFSLNVDEHKLDLVDESY